MKVEFGVEESRISQCHLTHSYLLSGNTWATQTSTNSETHASRTYKLMDCSWKYLTICSLGQFFEIIPLLVLWKKPIFIITAMSSSIVLVGCTFLSFHLLVIFWHYYYHPSFHSTKWPRMCWCVLLTNHSITSMQLRHVFKTHVTPQTQLLHYTNDARLQVEHSNMLSRGWHVITRAQPEWWHFNRGITYFNVPRASLLHLFCRMTNYEQVQNPDE